MKISPWTLGLALVLASLLTQAHGQAPTTPAATLAAAAPPVAPAAPAAPKICTVVFLALDLYGQPVPAVELAWHDPVAGTLTWGETDEYGCISVRLMSGSRCEYGYFPGRIRYDITVSGDCVLPVFP